MNVPQKITELVDKFERNAGQYRSSTYNETQVRQEFINPFFEALGWDVNNTKGVSPRFEPVIHEYSLDTGESKEAPDYAFRIGETVMFFVEAKKPSVNLENQPGPAYQIRKYAYSAKLPLSILTDFEEFIVYNGRIKPVSGERAEKGRISYYTYRDYIKEWDEIADVFSYDAIMQGGFDKFAKEHEKVKGQIPVDEQFLKDIEDWRETLAKSIEYRNREQELSVPDLNYAVQSIIDRIIFLRVCEDRGIEDKNTLYNIVKGEDVYSRLKFLFTEADAKYNSGLFHFKEEKGRPTSPDTLTPTLNIEDAKLRKVINSLYDGPYAFNVIPADILGSVYERFLGKEIIRTDSRVRIDDKPINKEHGVYYTPKYIVDYIVENTVGELLTKCKTPKNAAKLKILDPACGSGSFLIGAYQNLIDWHVDWYFNDGVDKHTDKIIPTVDAVDVVGGPPVSYRLSNEEKKRILLNNIYGVDIDAQAVEVTKLSLLLKALEGETKESIGSQVKLLKERVLPDLGENIKCGNSLIGKDYFDGQLQPDPEEYDRVNPFNWDEKFPDIIKYDDNGKIAPGYGFDGVIGNPPYVFTRSGKIPEKEKSYYYGNFLNTEYQLNTYVLFVEKSIQLSKASKGYFGMIIPNTWLTIDSLLDLRKFVYNLRGLTLIATTDGIVFDHAIVENSIIIHRTDGDVNYIRIFKMDETNVGFLNELDKAKPQTNYVIPSSGVLFDTLTTKVENIELKIGVISIVKSGLKAYEVGKGKPKQSKIDKDNRIYHSFEKKAEDYHPYLHGKDVKRYCIDWSGEFLRYGNHLAAKRFFELFTEPRILIRQIPSQPPYCIHAAFSDGIFINDINSHIIIDPVDYNLKYLLGLINSRLISYWFVKRFSKTDRKIFPQFKVRDVKQFPIIEIDFLNAADKKKHDDMVALVEAMLELNKRLQSANTPRDKESLEQQIADTDDKIDTLVYELYDLTDDEIATVEGK